MNVWTDPISDGLTHEVRFTNYAKGIRRGRCDVTIPVDAVVTAAAREAVTCQVCRGWQSMGRGDVVSTFSVGPRPMGLPRVYRDRTAASLTHSVWSSEPDFQRRVRMHCGLEVALKLTRVTPDKTAETDCPECLRALAAEQEAIARW